VQQYKVVVPDASGVSIPAVVKADVCETSTILTNEYSVFEDDQKYTVTFEGELEPKGFAEALAVGAAAGAARVAEAAKLVVSKKTDFADQHAEVCKLVAGGAVGADAEVATKARLVGLQKELTEAMEKLKEAEAEQERVSSWEKKDGIGWQIQSRKLEFKLACKASELWYNVTTVVEGKTHTPQMQVGRIGLALPLQDSQRLFMSKHKRYKLEHKLNNSSLQTSKNDGQNAIVRNVTIAGKCEVEYITHGENEGDSSSALSKMPTNVIEVSKIYELNTGLKDLLVDGDAKMTEVPHYNLRDHVLELSTPLAPPFSVGYWLHWPPNTAGKEALIVLFSSCKNEKVKDWVVAERSTGLIGVIDIEIGTDFKPITKVRAQKKSVCSLVLNT
jgi:hypothetical protein